MRNVAVIDESFDSSVTLSYHLSIQYGARDFSFAILDTVRLKYLAYKRYWFGEEIPREDQANRFRQILQADAYLTLPFHSVFFNYCSPESVLVPATLYLPSEKDAYFRHTAAIRETDKLHDHRLPEIDSLVIFPVPSDLSREVREKLHNARIIHQSCGQIAGAAHYRPDAPFRVFVQVHAGSADLMAFKADKLLIYNHFKFKNPEDLAFYILYLYEQLELPHQETRIILSGWIGLYPETFRLLDDYIRGTERMPLPAHFRYSGVFRELESWEISPIINLFSCES